ncbi:hypothetical protein FHG87_024147 [Trinorchestia longiramus]|nr:hypothetical protein FHG87_024147 [Trinorchestia longiramus]
MIAITRRKDQCRELLCRKAPYFMAGRVAMWCKLSPLHHDRSHYPRHLPSSLFGRSSSHAGKKSGFGAVVKADAPHIIVTHCILHRHALATKTFPPKLAEVLKIAVACVRHSIFSELCKEMGSEFEVLMYQFNIRWLFRGQVLNRVFAVRAELTLFLQEHQHCHADCFKNSEFILTLAYLVDIFAGLNHLNRKMQGGGVKTIEAK